MKRAGRSPRRASLNGLELGPLELLGLEYAVGALVALRLLLAAHQLFPLSLGEAAPRLLPQGERRVPEIGPGDQRAFAVGPTGVVARHRVDEAAADDPAAAARALLHVAGAGLERACELLEALEPALAQDRALAVVEGGGLRRVAEQREGGLVLLVARSGPVEADPARPEHVLDLPRRSGGQARGSHVELDERLEAPQRRRPQHGGRVDPERCGA